MRYVWQIKKYENSSQGQRSRSNVTNFQSLLGFTMGHIPTKLHQFLTGSFRDFVQTGRQTNAQTDRRRQKQYLLAACAQVKIYVSFCSKKSHRARLYDITVVTRLSSVHPVYLMNRTVPAIRGREVDVSPILGSGNGVKAAEDRKQTSLQKSKAFSAGTLLTTRWCCAPCCDWRAGKRQDTCRRFRMLHLRMRHRHWRITNQWIWQVNGPEYQLLLVHR